MDQDAHIDEPDVEDGFHHPALSAEQAAKLTRFARCLQAGGRTVNLTRILETPAIYLRHFADALQALPILAAQGAPGRLLDVGSGPGVPGLVLACVCPAWHVTSLEATGKKVRFQESTVLVLGLGNVTVCCGRAEAMAHQGDHREGYDIVTARALAPLPTLLELCVPFLKVQGILLAFKGPDVRPEVDRSRGALATLGCSVEVVTDYALAALAQQIGVLPPPEEISLSLVIVRKNSATPSCYPRTYGVIRRQPL